MQGCGLKLQHPCCSRQEGLFEGDLLYQSLHCHAHLHQALLLQDVVRKTQLVLGANRRESRDRNVGQSRDRRGQRRVKEQRCKKTHSSHRLRHNVCGERNIQKRTAPLELQINFFVSFLMVCTAKNKIN